MHDEGEEEEEEEEEEEKEEHDGALGGWGASFHC